MGRKGKGVGYKFTVNKASDTEEASGSDSCELVVSDSESSSQDTKKYTFTGFKSGKTSSIFECRKLTRNERLCLIFGAFALGVILIIFVLVASVVNGQATPTSPPGEQRPWMNVRLPWDIVPMTYEIMLDVDLMMSVVTGDIHITCNVTTPTQYVLIHAKDMDVSATHVSYPGNSALDLVIKTFFYEMNDFYVIQLQELLLMGPVSVHIAFNYTLRTDLAGFYRSSYTTSEGTKQSLATTQFEPTDARRAFPCFDEPSFKADFTITIKHNSSLAQYWVASNMPVQHQDESDGVSTTRFKTSFEMSTYLVAFVLSDFKCVNSSIQSVRGGRVEIRVCSNPAVVNKTSYALTVATEVLSYYEHMFGVPYPLPKLDLFAIPDFSAGAMENWGLVTYRETALLYDNQTDPEISKQRVAIVIAHELAHQWFGNLVTMAWWDGLWLNEGFASFMEYIGTNSTEPDWDMMDLFVVGDLSSALTADSLNESHPILQNVSSPNEINSLFDSISYSKGGSVIRMLRAYLGASNFKAGIHQYLIDHSYGNAETPELWEALDQQAGNSRDVHVTQMMDTWTKQMGYPVLTVNKSANNLSQTRFFAVTPEDKNTIPLSPYNYTWYVPFDYITDTGYVESPKLMVHQTEPWSWPGSVKWIKLNVDQTGFYRVNYETDNWWKLIDHLKRTPNSVLSRADRAGLLDDAFALSSAGQLCTLTAFNLSSYLRGERDYLPWAAALSWIHTVGVRLSLTPVYGKYKQYVLNLLEPAVQEVWLANGSLTHLQIFLRSSLLQAAWQFGNTDVIEWACKYFKQWKNSNVFIVPDLKDVVYQVGVAYGSQADWDFVWQQYQSSTDPYEKRLYLRALAQSTEPWILNRYLNYSITKLRKQDTLTVLVYVSQNVHGRYLAWNFARNNWNYISETFSESSFFDRVILYITSAFTTELELYEVKEFFKQHPNAGSGTRAYRQAIEVIRGNILWLEANLDKLDSCFTNTTECFA